MLFMNKIYCTLCAFVVLLNVSFGLTYDGHELKEEAHTKHHRPHINVSLYWPILVSPRLNFCDT